MHAAPSPLCALSNLSGLDYHFYPSADRFVEACAVDNLVRAMKQRRAGTAVMGLPLALYLPMPFCEQSGCRGLRNTISAKHRHRMSIYVDALTRELDQVVQSLGSGQVVNRLHLGAGIPNCLSDEALQSLIATLKRNFRLSPRGEYSLQVDPLAFDDRRLAMVTALGFNQLRIELQELGPTRQDAFHRIQETRQVFTLVEAARSLRFQTISISVGYNWSSHSPDANALALSRAIAFRPNRITFRTCASQLRRCPLQRCADRNEPLLLIGPTASTRYACSLLDDAGYLHLGMNEFALPDDALSVARRQGRLHRDFQGYSAQPDGDLIGLGVSAISRVGAIYGQNARTIDEYHHRLNRQQLPIVSGLALSRDDLLRWSVITALLCQGRVPFEALGVWAPEHSEQIRIAAI